MYLRPHMPSKALLVQPVAVPYTLVCQEALSSFGVSSFGMAATSLTMGVQGTARSDGSQRCCPHSLGLLGTWYHSSGEILQESRMPAPLGRTGKVILVQGVINHCVNC